MFCVDILSQVKSNSFFSSQTITHVKDYQFMPILIGFGYYEGVQIEEYCGIHPFHNWNELAGLSVVWKFFALRTKTNVYV